MDLIKIIPPLSARPNIVFIHLMMFKKYIMEKREVGRMEFVIAIGVFVIAITCLSIEGKLRKNNELNQQIIELLKKKLD
ncbi:hypothetical protein [Aquibacillus sediminis]|uniref:hypothetical protein n=1 Tax=Aquibacillus sediminis TaxID=2574734 RepID=UPI001486BC05|nr:hypothetical protein [Aquibacillus sediminis]